jgi:glycosyltransferase involved in cell wall biosynthesis
MLSFIVPAYNEERYLPATLAAIHASARELGIDYEVVVADDGSTDATARIAEEAGARVVHVHHRQISKTRNSGAREARGERLVFVDADTHINAPLLRAAIAALDDGAVGGGARPGFAAEAPAWAHRLIRSVVGFMAFFRWSAGCFVFARRDAFEVVGGFDERHFAGEEIMLSRAMKRQGAFVILREGLLTSPRKLMARGPWETAWLVIRLLARGMGGVRTRDHAQFWYDGRR